MRVILSEAKDLALSLINPIGSSFVVRLREALSRSVVNLGRVNALELIARSFASLRMTRAVGFSAACQARRYVR